MITRGFKTNTIITRGLGGIFQPIYQSFVSTSFVVKRTLSTRIFRRIKAKTVFK